MIGDEGWLPIERDDILNPLRPEFNRISWKPPNLKRIALDNRLWMTGAART